jgi:hypothetical protein
VGFIEYAWLFQSQQIYHGKYKDFLQNNEVPWQFWKNNMMTRQKRCRTEELQDNFNAYGSILKYIRIQ